MLQKFKSLLRELFSAPTQLPTFGTPLPVYVETKHIPRKNMKHHSSVRHQIRQPWSQNPDHK